ncbi:MAG: LptA/OstA family protein [Kiritimatiellia bacterium]
MKFVIRCLFMAVVVATVAAPHDSLAKNPLAMMKTVTDMYSNLEILADKFEVDRQSGWTTATGNVSIKAYGHELTADRARLHQERGDVQARGNVVIKREGLGAWTGDYIEYNYKTGKGLTGSGFVRAGEFFIASDEITRASDGRTEAHHAIVSTCTNDVDHLHWCVTGNVIYKENDYIVVKNAVPWLFGIPVGYMPYYYRDLDRHYGFRLVPGYTSKWGAFLLGGYVFNIYSSERGAGPNLDGRTHLDYRTKRGVAVGQDLIWDLKRWGKGRFEGYYAWDEDTPDKFEDRNWVSTVPDNRYRYRLQHKADLTPRDQFLLRGTYSSDSEMNHDFFLKKYREESTPMNFMSLEHREHTWAGGAIVSGPLNDFYGGVARLPEGWVNITPQPIFNTPLNYESQSRAGMLNRDAAHYKNASPNFRYSPGEWADYNLTRVDTAHRVTLPFKVQDVLAIVPRAGYRGTFYSDSELDGELIRHAAEMGVEASVRGTAELANGGRHIFEPYLDYSYQPVWYEGDDVGGRLYTFDRHDRSYGWLDQFGMDGTWLPYDWHGFRPGIRNIWQQADDHNVMRNVFLWDAYTAIQIDSEGNYSDKGMSLVGTRLVYTPSEKLDVKMHTEYDSENEKFAYVNFATFYELQKGFRLGGGYLGRDHELYDYDRSRVPQWNRVNENLAYGGFTHDINSVWSYSLYARYDLRYNSLDEIGGYIQYSLDCLVFRLHSAYVNSFERIDGESKRDDDFRVAFTMWFKAENRNEHDEWLTW